MVSGPWPRGLDKHRCRMNGEAIILEPGREPAILARPVALPGVALLPGLARRGRALQADGDRRRLGANPAAGDDAGVRARLQQGGPSALGRGALPLAGAGRHVALAAVRQRRGRFEQQPGRQRELDFQGILPTLGRAAQFVGRGPHRLYDRPAGAGGADARLRRRPRLAVSLPASVHRPGPGVGLRPRPLALCPERALPETCVT